MSQSTYLTVEGKAELEKELELLINERRPALAAKLKEAVSQGDLRENADYHDAKEQQAFVEGRIQYLENVLRSAVIIAPERGSDIVIIGSVVTIREEDGDEDEKYMIVGAAEANPREGKISHESPIGKALLSHKAGDRVRVKTPAGETIFKIKSID
jgi:transcription elongation factor GreA